MLKKIELILKRQLENNFLDLSEEEVVHLNENIELAYKKSVNCFKWRNSDYFKTFNCFNSVQWTIFLYYLSNIIYVKAQNRELSDKIYYLNKVMNSVDIYSSVELPDIFCFEHPVGSVFGKAKYGNKFFAYQNCTVGGNKDKKSTKINYPQIGNNVMMFSYSCILGNSKIGNNVIISSHTYIKDQDIPNDTIVFGSSPNLIFKKIKDRNNVFKEAMEEIL